MLSRLDTKHYIFVCKHCTYKYHSTTQSFSKYLEEKIKKLLYVLYHIGAVNKIVKLV